MRWGGIVCAAEGGGKQSFDYGDYGAVLKEFVDERGMVDYKGLKAKRGRLNAYVAAIGKVSNAEYVKWSRQEQVAFWINAYNGLTLKAIIDNYPIKSGLLASLRYPKNSIRQISGVWDKLKFTVMGREMTLDEIEHKTLRKKFDEPRIHVALVCAAMGCPPLRNEPYTEAKLNKQLDDQAKKFMAHPEKFKIDRGQKRVYLSSIFKWFDKDFVNKYGPSTGFKGHDKEEQAVLNFVSRYLSANDAEYLRGGKYKIKYLDYDWSLNEQKPKK